MRRGNSAWPALAIAMVFLVVPGHGPFAEAESSSPMTDEDVVRLFVAGRSADDLLEEIERREPDFDVSPEMLDELRAAGLPPTVIEAMVRRQRAADAASLPVEVVEPDDGLPTVRIRLVSGKRGGKRPVLTVTPSIDPEVAVAWRLGTGQGKHDFTDVAIYLACVTPDHVPDHWRSKSPMGKDFVSMPRHRIAAFEAGARREGKDAKARLVLDLPTVIEAELAPGVPHDLLLGVALRVEDRYRRIVDDAWPGLVLDERGLDLVATVDQRSGKGAPGFKVRFEGEPDDEGDETGDPVEP